MAEEEAGYDTFVDYIQSACVMEAAKVRAGFPKAREYDEFTWQGDDL